MTRRGGEDTLKVVGAGLLFVAAFLGLAYLKNGKGESNSPFVPDTLEDRLDAVVGALNRNFGQRWVNIALNFLERQMELAMPGAAALVNAAYLVELNHAGQAGAIKKQAALRMLRA
jgi:hypothetical protein